jgi:hypothetical protein
MNPTVYREACGTHRGLILHQSAQEEPCGCCRYGEKLRRLQAEAIPQRQPAQALSVPSSAGAVPPVTPAQAAANRRLLEAELEEYERTRGHLRVVNG